MTDHTSPTKGYRYPPLPTGLPTVQNPRYPHPVDEIAAIDAEIAVLTTRRDAITALHRAAKALVEMGYSRRQVRAMAGFDLDLGRKEPE